MARTITVKGIGKASAKPDYVVFSMTLESKHKDYDKAMDMAADHIQQLNETLCGIGFEKGSVKTTNFSVRTDYDRVKDRNGNYQNVFCGYEVTHNLKLAFGLIWADCPWRFPLLQVVCLTRSFRWPLP